MGAFKNDSSLDVRMLRIFAAVACADSLSAAAQTLGITQSAVSQTLTQIETILGMKVLDRSRRPYRLTPAGATLQRQSRQIVDDMDRLTAQVREAGLLSRPAIRIGMIDSFAATVGSSIVKRLTQNASQVLVWAGLAYGQSQALLSRQVDIIVTTDALEDIDGLARRPILAEPFVLVVPKSRADEFAKLDLHQIVQAAPLIRFSLRSHFGAMIERHFRRCGVTAPAFLEIDTSDVVMAMVAANLGWTMTTPLCLLQGRFWLDQVAVLPLPGARLARTLVQVSRHDEFQDMADTFWQTSRTTLADEIIPQVKTWLPWLGSQMRLC